MVKCLDMRQLDKEIVEFIHESLNQNDVKYGFVKKTIQDIESQFGVRISDDTVRRYLSKEEKFIKAKEKQIIDRGSVPYHKLSKEIYAFMTTYYEEHIEERRIYSKIVQLIKHKFGVVVDLRTVSRHIKKKFPNARNSPRVWSEKEDEILNNFAGFIPFPELCKRIQNLNERERQLKRSDESIMTRCCGLGLSVSVQGLHISKKELLRGLGVSSSKLDVWLKDKKLAKR